RRGIAPTAPSGVCRSRSRGCDIATPERALKIEAGPVARRDEVVELGVPFHPVVDEGAEGEDLEALGARPFEREAGQPAAEAVAFEALVDLGVDQGEQAGAKAVDERARRLAVDGHLEAP